MRTVRFVHAADLHLDAAFSGVSAQAPSDLAAELHASTFTALSRLETLCLSERPDFLTIAGDLYNEEDGSLAAQIAVRDMCARLDQAGVPVFIAHGNHDPLSSRMKTLVWPTNVTVFGEEVEAFPVLAGDEAIAVVHGISHAMGHEERNLARLFKRARSVDTPARPRVRPQIRADGLAQIGVLHCTVGEADTRYAPCSLADLEASGLDYWALGHVHTRAVFGRRGHIAYPGSIQGLHINESGPHGCYLVTLHGRDRVEHEFFPLGPVQWRQVAIDLGGLESAQNMVGVHDQTLERLFADMEDGRDGADLYAVRLTFTGRSALDGLLRKPGAIAELTGALRESGLAGRPRVWVKDIAVASRPEADLEILRGQRDDLLGESLRCAEQLRAEPEALAAVAGEVFADLFKNRLMRDTLEAFSAEETRDLLKAAELACLDLLELESPEAE